MTDAAVWSIRCPGCGGAIGDLPRPPAATDRAEGPPAGGREPDVLPCPACAAVWPRRDGIWRLLAPDDEARTAAFVAEYTAVRHAEGRASMTAAQRLALPYGLPTTPLAWQWGVRAASYRVLCRFALAGRAPGRVVDIGAGGGWLSWRLAVGGWSALALDISDDAGDGLGAAAPYATDLAARGLSGRLVRAVAHLGRLPLTDGAADAAVLNASLHYAADPAAALAEAARVVRPGGLVCVVDSPTYGRRASGERMVAERTARFVARYGFPSTAQGSREFLVDGELEAIGDAIGLSFRRIRPWVDLRWAMRPLAATLRGRREPARFNVSVGECADRRRG